MTKLLLFDVDGTITLSGQPLEKSMANALKNLRDKGFDLGIVGGGTREKILSQLGDIAGLFTYVFSECGCIYHRNQYMIYKKNIRHHPLYSQINILIKKALEFLSQVDYDLTGHFIDMRTGIVYVSLIGMSATVCERNWFMKLDAENLYRQRLLDILRTTAIELGINNKVDILEGGSVGLSIYPSEWNKSQVVQLLLDTTNYTEIHYFGDKYRVGENDHDLINHSAIIGHKVDSIADTMEIITQLC